MNIQITKNRQIKEIEAFVESESKEGVFYKVTFVDHWECTCPAGRINKSCKHIEAVKEETVWTNY